MCFNLQNLLFYMHLHLITVPVFCDWHVWENTLIVRIIRLEHVFENEKKYLQESLLWNPPVYDFWNLENTSFFLLNLGSLVHKINILFLFLHWQCTCIHCSWFSDKHIPLKLADGVSRHRWSADNLDLSLHRYISWGQLS
jgi:hypothetical protein